MKTITRSIKSTNKPYITTLSSIESFDSLPDSAFISLPVVCTMFGCSPATIWRRVRQGDLVAPHRIGKRTTRWELGQIRTALANAKKLNTKTILQH